jgi:hypothetical protein
MSSTIQISANQMISPARSPSCLMLGPYATKSASQENFWLAPSDQRQLRIYVVYRIPCECNKVCIGQTGRSVETRLKEHKCIRLEHLDRSDIGEHCIYSGTHTLFHYTILNL